MKIVRSPSALLWTLLAVVLLWRLATLGLYPLMDTTEARYGEMARKMLETGNWVTPLFDYGVPFWGKPPLSFWTSAASMAVFGVNEFGARFGPWMCTLAVVAAMLRWHSVAAGPSRLVGLLGALVLTSTFMGFLAAGAVMTDMAMTAGTTLSMVAFWRSVQDCAARSGSATVWPWLFFIGQAIGLLAKGPVALVLTALPIAVWVASQRAWGVAWDRLPWLRGGLLMLALALPWYVLAEQRTPGFLRYFLIGEHFDRFTQSGWKGDLYGAGHARPLGTIWLYGVAATLPWPLVPLWMGRLRWRSKPYEKRELRPEPIYLLCWALSPLVFFTPARNILPAYVLPGLPAFALLVAGWMTRPGERDPDARPARWAVWPMALAAPALLSGVLLVGMKSLEVHSQRSLLRALPAEDIPVVYLYYRPFSAQFYTAGKAIKISDADAAWARIDSRQPAHLVVPRIEASELADAFSSGCWRSVASHGGYRAFGLSDSPGCTLPATDQRDGSAGPTYLPTVAANQPKRQSSRQTTH